MNFLNYLKKEKNRMKKDLTIKNMKLEASKFASYIASLDNQDIRGITDGKAVGTYLEKHFKEWLQEHYNSDNWGNAAKGIDLPSVNTDIKFTSIKQPQSSLPYKSASQKVLGLGYNLLVFVYDKDDSNEHNIKFIAVDFVVAEHTADFQITKQLLDAVKNEGNDDDLFAILSDRNLPGDEITYRNIIEQVKNGKLKQGYLTISNALQWRAQYGRIIQIAGTVEGVDKLYGE